MWCFRKGRGVLCGVALKIVTALPIGKILLLFGFSPPFPAGNFKLFLKGKCHGSHLMRAEALH